MTVLDPSIFQIEEGEFALALIDTGALGYLSTWNAPGGDTAETAALADYDTDADNWFAQVTSGQITASPNSNDRQVPATFGAAARVIPQPGETSYNLDIEWLQDSHLSTGLSRFLFDHDTEEAYFLLGMNDGEPPRAIGRVRLIAGSFGGPARDNLTSSVSLPLVRKPSISFGDATTSIITAMPSREQVEAAKKAAEEGDPNRGVGLANSSTIPVTPRAGRAAGKSKAAATAG
jgi:hypothetical protein